MSRPFERTVGVQDDTVASATTHLAERELPAGTQVGRYLITGVLGRGGMGVVYAAHDPNLDRRIALKLLHDTFNPEHLVREAQALAKLDDPHVVTVFDAGELDGHVFIAMQLVDGEDLSTALATRKPSHAQILHWFVEAGRGLAAAHAAGLVHRDFKPHNVLIDRRGRVAVTDFGLAHSTTPEAEATRLTGSGLIAGTPAYMAPEQHGLEAATQASDQFSFCVAVWEALFGQHPYVSGPRDSMSPFAIGYAIYDGPLIPPPRTTVSREIVDALTRGLARDPATRWPSLAPLLDVLAPLPRRRIWPFVAGGLAAAITGGVVVLALAGGNRDDRPTCATTARERADSVWSAATSKLLGEQFAKTGRSYAQVAANQATAGLDHYASTWSQLVADSCTEEQTAKVSAELAQRKQECLDARLDAMRVLVGLVTQESRREFVDHAQTMVDGLPVIADCTDTASLLAGPGTVPLQLAGSVKALTSELELATARMDGGDFETARTLFTAIAARADAFGWPATIARAHLALGLIEMKMQLPARDELFKAAEVATVNHLDRQAVRAWAGAMQSAGYDRSPDAVAALLPMARGAAARVRDPELELAVDVTYGRALVRLGKWKQGGELCRRTLAQARNILDGTVVADNSRDCIVEALVPQGAYAEVEPMLVELIADRSKRYGADHPSIADFLALHAGLARASGDLVKARAEAERALEIRRRAFPARHVKIADSLLGLADLLEAEDKADQAKALYEEALAIAIEAKPTPVLMISTIETALGYLAAKHHDHKGAIAHFDHALEVVRTNLGNDSIELAILLLNYGQVRAVDNFDAGVGLLGEGRDILERAHDRRASVAGAALAMTLVQHSRYAEARKLLQDALAHAGPDLDPHLLGQMKFALAQSIIETKGDRQHANELAADALRDLAKAGPAEAEEIRAIHAWLAKHP